MAKGKNVSGLNELVERIKSADPGAVEEFVKEYSSKVFSLAYSLTRSEAAAEEIMQEVFITVITKINTLENNEYFSTWLYRVTMNAAYGFLRKEKKYSVKFQADDSEIDSAASTDFAELPDNVLESDESMEIINRAIDSLPKSIRTIVILKDVEGLKNEDIAATMRLSLSAVKSRLHRGRLMLRNSLSKHFRRYA